MKSLRDMLEDETTEAENAIKNILQKFHNTTGMIPTGISFNVIDVKSCSPNEPRKVVLISSVDLRSNT